MGVNEMGNLAEEMHHAAFAFLDPVNRNETLKEHACSFYKYEDKEKILFEHPEWLLDHYFRYSGVDAELGEEEQKKMSDFLLKNSSGKQITLSFLCPVNRNSTRCELGYDDSDLLYHYQSLILHFVSSGGAEANAEERKNLMQKKC